MLFIFNMKYISVNCENEVRPNSLAIKIKRKIRSNHEMHHFAISDT